MFEEWEPADPEVLHAPDRARPKRSAMTIREAGPADHDAVDRVALAAFGDHGRLVVRLIHALRVLPAERPGLELVAEEGGTIIGHALWSAAWLDTARRLVDVQVLSPLAVAPGRQRRGIGRALVAAGADRLAGRGVPAVVLEGDPSYYSRIGFLPGTARGLRRPSLRIPEAAFQVLPLPAYEPWMRGTIVYPDPFWSLDAVGLREPPVPTA